MKPSSYKSALCYEPYLFFEMRETAKLKVSGLTDDDIVTTVFQKNLYQYPTEKRLKQRAKVCLRRLRALSKDLITLLAEGQAQDAKQICLYALMLDNKLVRDFFVGVIGEKYRTLNLSYDHRVTDRFLNTLYEQYDDVAAWSDSTKVKNRQVLRKTVVDAGYIDDKNADHLNPIVIVPALKENMIQTGITAMLPAFNCFDV